MSKTTDPISNELNRLEKFGYEVYNFNVRKPQMNRGMKGIPDYLIIGKKILLFIEVKRKGDSYRLEQLIFKDKIETITKLKNSPVFYTVIHTEVDAINLVNYLLTSPVNASKSTIYF